MVSYCSREGEEEVAFNCIEEVELIGPKVRLTREKERRNAV